MGTCLPAMVHLLPILPTRIQKANKHVPLQACEVPQVCGALRTSMPRSYFAKPDLVTQQAADPPSCDMLTMLWHFWLDMGLHQSASALSLMHATSHHRITWSVRFFSMQNPPRLQQDCIVTSSKYATHMLLRSAIYSSGSRGQGAGACLIDEGV